MLGDIGLGCPDVKRFGQSVRRHFARPKFDGGSGLTIWGANILLIFAYLFFSPIKGDHVSRKSNSMAKTVTTP